MINTLNLLDTSVSTDNLGDLIIVDSIRRVLSKELSQRYVTSVSTHDSVGRVGRDLIRKADVNLLLGTNALTSKNRVGKPDMWRVKHWDVSALKNSVVLCGVGWRNYQQEVKKRQAKFYHNILKTDMLHSVRDSHAENMLKSIGIDNVLNTTCPTTWCLTPQHCKAIPTQQANTVVFTLTRHKGAKEDIKLIEYLIKLYDIVYFWPQQIEDTIYLESIASNSQFKSIRHIPASLAAFDNFLQETDTDFVGTRLHGGIRAMQYKRRSYIIGIDNRAKEIAKDINLPVLNRDEIESLPSIMESDISMDITLPTEKIDKWRSQFAI